MTRFMFDWSPPGSRRPIAAEYPQCFAKPQRVAGSFANEGAPAWREKPHDR